MRGKIVDCKSIAFSIKQKIKNEILNIQQKHQDFRPRLAIIQVGNKMDSSKYVSMKQKAAEESNIISEIFNLPEVVNEAEILDLIQKLNKEKKTNGIIVQLPLPENIDRFKITSAVSPQKDVDCFTPYNQALLLEKSQKPFFLPCTPKGIIEILERSNVQISGKNAVVIGRSDIVGKPISYLLTNKDANVTLLHSKTTTENLKLFLLSADIVIIAIGKPEFIRGEWLKKGSVVIDVGINYVPSQEKKSGHVLMGDVQFESALEVVSLITPVPGGVGPMTVASLLQNVFEAAVRQFEDS